MQYVVVNLKCFFLYVCVYEYVRRAGVAKNYGACANSGALHDFMWHTIPQRYLL